MAVSIPLTSTTDLYTSPAAAVFDFGGTPYTTGYLWVQNAGVFVSLKRGSSQGATDWTPDFPTGPALVPLVGGAPSLGRPNGPDRIFGVRARSLAVGVPAVVYGGVFQDGETAVIPSTQASGTITTGGVVTPAGTAMTGFVNSNGTIAGGTGFSVVKGAAGIYTVNYTTAFSSIPNIQVTPADQAVTPWLTPMITAVAVGSFTVEFRDPAANPTDQAFFFLVTETL